MTKTVRVENADNSPYKVKVYPEYRQGDGTWARREPYTGDITLHYPCDMVNATIYADKRLIIEELHD